ncbi:hypothetical protein ACMFMF_011187 [Clarireedia jacksonii]
MTMEAVISTFVESLNVSNEIASTISSTYVANDGLATFLFNDTSPAAKKRSLPILTLWHVGNSSFYSVACQLPAQCVVSPASTEEVSLMMKVISFLQTPFAVRSGGHSPNPDFSSIGSSGVLISTSNLNAITVSPDNSVASIGPGQRWGAVYEALDPYGVSVVGGRIPQVGVAGLILGGGLSHFSSEYGLAADNVKNFEVVLASGELANANAETNTDLFYSLKGEGPNFGIVTRLDLYTIPVRNIWFQATGYALSELPNVLAAFTEWQQNGAQTDTKSSVLLNILNTGISIGLVYAAPATYPEAFAPFAAIPNGVVAVPPTNSTVSVLTSILASSFSTTPARHLYRSAASLIDEKLYNETSAYFIDTLNALQTQQNVNVNMTYTLQTIPPSLVKAGEARGGNSIGIPSQAHQWWTTVTDWSSASDDNTVIGAVKDIGDSFMRFGTPRKTSLSFVYMNDCYADQNPLAQYPAKNIAFLKEIAGKIIGGQYYCAAITNTSLGFGFSKRAEGSTTSTTPAQNGTVTAEGVALAQAIYDGLHKSKGERAYLSW